MSAMVSEFFADFVCPWCFVGWRSLRAAQALRPAYEHRTLFRPFLLRPEPGHPGVDRAAFYAARAAENPERAKAVRAALEEAAAQTGARLQWEKPARIPPTHDAHRLLIWAAGQGRGLQAADALFEAYFEQGRDIGEIETLGAVAEEIGLDAALVGDLLASEADVARVGAAHGAAAAQGVTGVPVAVFNRRAAAIGYEPPEAYAAAMDKAAAAST